MKISKTLVATALLLGIGFAQAGQAYEPALKSFETLAKASDSNFKGLKEAEIKRMREDFSSKAQAATSAAKSEYAALSKGKTSQQMDKLLWERTEKVGMAGAIKADIDAMGGPSKAMEQTDRIVAEFVREVMDDSRPQTKVSLVEAVVTALVMAQPAHARTGAFRRQACYFFWWTVSVGEGTAHAYKSCDR